MQTIVDICKQTFYMGLFVVMIPLIAYMIHNGSSAVVALVTYLIFSFLIPLGYVGAEIATFGPHNRRISRFAYMLGWLAVQGGTYASIFLGVDLSMLWGWPTIGRDIAFLVVMFVQIAVAIMIGYVVSRLVGGRHE